MPPQQIGLSQSEQTLTILLDLVVILFQFSESCLLHDVRFLDFKDSYLNAKYHLWLIIILPWSSPWPHLVHSTFMPNLLA